MRCRIVPFVLVLVLVVGVSGCGGGGGGSSKETGGSSENAEGVPLVEDAAATGTTSDAEGAEAIVEVDGSSAGVIVLPDTFPASTALTATPVAADAELPGEAVGPTLHVSAGDGVQPDLPVFIGFDIAGELPDTTVVVAMSDDGSDLEILPTSVTVANGRTTLTAQSDHLTIFRPMPGDDPVLVEPPAPVAEPDWQSWTIKVNGAPLSVPEDPDQVWLLTYNLVVDATNGSGWIPGTYEGTASFSVKGELDPNAPALAELPDFVKAVGTIDAAGSGTAGVVVDDLWHISSVKTQLQPGDPYVHVGMCFRGKGSAKLFGIGDMSTFVTVPEGGAGWEDTGVTPGTGEIVPLLVEITPSGPLVTIPGIGTWRGLLVGVPLQ